MLSLRSSFGSLSLDKHADQLNPNNDEYQGPDTDDE